MWTTTITVNMNHPSVLPTLVAPIDHVYGTLGLVKATTTRQYAGMSKVREEIEGQGSFTMFAPSDEAWNLLLPVSRPGPL